MEAIRDNERGVAAIAEEGDCLKYCCWLRGVTMERTRGVVPGGVLIEKHRGVELTACSLAGIPPMDSLRGVGATCGLSRSRPRPGIENVELTAGSATGISPQVVDATW